MRGGYGKVISRGSDSIKNVAATSFFIATSLSDISHKDCES